LNIQSKADQVKQEGVHDKRIRVHPDTPDISQDLEECAAEEGDEEAPSAVVNAKEGLQDEEDAEDGEVGDIA